MIIGFLRYNAFFVLYPLGVGAELMCCYLVWEYIRTLKENEKPFTVNMPNKFNISFSFELFIQFIIPLCYLNFPPMFMHMYWQRAKYYREEKLKRAQEILHVDD